MRSAPDSYRSLLFDPRASLYSRQRPDGERRGRAEELAMADPWRFQRVTLPNGLRMRIARAGSGPLMVMLHGFPECWYSWRHQLRAFAPHFTCVAPEMRGYGETDAPVGVANYKGELLIDDVAGLIKTLGYERAI